MSSRSALVARLRARLLRRGFPRLQMGVLVALTCGLGFIGSSLLLEWGVERMSLRYGLAVVVAYLGFLMLLRVWTTRRAHEAVDGGDLPDVGAGAGRTPEAFDFAGRGGEFGGGGASGSFDAPAHSLPDVPDALGGALDGADEAAIPIVAILVVVAIAFSSVWLIYMAPTLMAELALDLALGAGLYRRLRGIGPGTWLETAVRRTIWPFLLTATVVVVAAVLAQWFVPDARTIGDVLLSLH